MNRMRAMDPMSQSSESAEKEELAISFMSRLEQTTVGVRDG